jgi:hypothetical protein
MHLSLDKSSKERTVTLSNREIDVSKFYIKTVGPDPSAIIDGAVAYLREQFTTQEDMESRVDMHLLQYCLWHNYQLETVEGPELEFIIRGEVR